MYIYVSIYLFIYKWSGLITGQLLIEPKINTVKWLTQSVCFNHWSINNKTQHLISKIAKT